MSPDKILTIAAETAYPASAPSARVRVASFAPHLVRHGVDMRYRPTMTEHEYATVSSGARPARKAAALARAALRARFAHPSHREELLLVHRLRFLAPLPGFEPSHDVDVYDFDDALFLGSILYENRRFSWLKREASRHMAYLKKARLVIAGNSYLASYARTYARRVEIIPSCVDPSVQPLRRHEAREPVTVGWIGSRSTAGYVNDVLPAFARLNANGMRARLVVIGGELASSAPWFESRTWSLSRQREDLASFDIGIMPMPDTAWTRGKCGYKLLQYFSAGVPAIASAVGVNKALIGDDRGTLVAPDGDWLGPLSELVEDAERRRAMGAAARAFVGREFSYERWAPELANLLRGL